VLQIEEFYQVLLWAERIAPECDPSDVSSVRVSLETLLSDAADLVAKELDLALLSEIRSYRNIEDPRIVEAMLHHFVEECPDREYCRLWEELGIAKVLNAPAETAGEFAEWLMSEHRALIDGIACVRCFNPIPYDYACLLGDAEGERYFHDACADAYMEESRQQL
jgi:hypothetical protein